MSNVRLRWSAIGGLVVLAASIVVLGRTPGVKADDGDAVLAGRVNTQMTTTHLYTLDWAGPGSECTIDDAGMNVCGTIGLAGAGVTIGLWGKDDGGFRSSIGVKGTTGQGTGVLGTATTGTGVEGQSSGFNEAVSGQNTGEGIGVSGDSAAGIGMRASSSDGTALEVLGRAEFQQSGITTIKAGTASKTLGLLGVTHASMVLATAQQTGPAWVKAATVASPNHIVIYLNRNAPTGGLKVAYFVLN